MANSNPVQVPINEITQALMNFTSTMLNSFSGLLQKLEADVTGADKTKLQGETEELLRLIMQGTDKAIEMLLSIHQQLQQSIIESYFPAQD